MKVSEPGEIMPNNGKTSRCRRESGFTLIEVMVVVVILAILATIVVPRIMDRPDQARVTKARQDIRAIEAALNLYRLDNFRYPSTDENLDMLVPKYLDRVPEDPWGNSYLYLSPGEHGDFDIFSLGADGAEGGDGVDADVGNWNAG
jgi:general secretion pathway protein G